MAGQSAGGFVREAKQGADGRHVREQCARVCLSRGADGRTGGDKGVMYLNFETLKIIRRVFVNGHDIGRGFFPQ